MTTTLGLTPASSLPTAADTLAAAFEHYPWTRYVLPEADYFARLRELQLLYLGHAHAHGVVITTQDCEGVIALLPPDAPEPRREVINRIVSLHGDRIARLDQTPPTKEAWRLETLGVHPDHQGRGTASALIEFALSEVTARGAHRIALETSDVRNVRLYERYGFAVVSHHEKLDVPPVWAMTAALNSENTTATNE